MVSEQTMVFMSVFSVMHQLTGTMGEHRCLYASGGTWLGMKMHAWTHCCGENMWFHCNMIEMLFKLWSTLCLSLTHTQTHTDANRKPDKSPLVCRAGMPHVVRQHQEPEEPFAYSWPQVTVYPLTFWPALFQGIRSKNVKMSYGSIQSWKMQKLATELES